MNGYSITSPGMCPFRANFSPVKSVWPDWWSRVFILLSQRLRQRVDKRCICDLLKGKCTCPPLNAGTVFVMIVKDHWYLTIRAFGLKIHTVLLTKTGPSVEKGFHRASVMQKLCTTAKHSGGNARPSIVQANKTFSAQESLHSSRASVCRKSSRLTHSVLNELLIKNTRLSMD